MARQWTAGEVLQLASSYQGACVLAAAADLELFDKLAGGDFPADEAARRLGGDLRATSVLLDALAALGLLEKRGDRYHIAENVLGLLSGRGAGNVLAMAQHQANCMRRWVQLARVVKTGRPAEREPSVRGEEADYASFIEAMDNISAPMAPQVVGDLQPQPFRHLLDVGGASGSWTIAFLASYPGATATIFDLPQVIPQAKARIAEAGLGHRVRFVGGDYLVDGLPKGADVAWVSAIIHSLSRQENRKLFASVFAALEQGGRILIRDVFMDESRTSPAYGALFAVNMLTATEGGGTYTLEEVREDLESAGFGGMRVVRKDEGMNAVVEARKAE